MGTLKLKLQYFDLKSRLIGKDPDAGKDWKQEEKGTTEDEIVGWHHQLDGHESEQTPGDGEGQGSLACCSPWGCKELDTTEWPNNNSPHFFPPRCPTSVISGGQSPFPAPVPAPWPFLPRLTLLLLEPLSLPSPWLIPLVPSGPGLHPEHHLPKEASKASPSASWSFPIVKLSFFQTSHYHLYSLCFLPPRPQFRFKLCVSRDPHLACPQNRGLGLGLRNGFYKELSSERRKNFLAVKAI